MQAKAHSDLSLVADAKLVDELRCGCHAAFAELVDRHSEMMFRIAWRTLSDRQDAEDVVQNVLLKFWQRPSWRKEGRASLSTWLYRLALNSAFDALRRRRNQVLWEDCALVDESSGGEGLVFNLQRSEAVHRLLRKLPARQHQALILCYFEGLSQRHASEVMCASPKAVESLLGRGLRRLRELCADDLACRQFAAEF